MKNKTITRFGSGAPWESMVGYSRMVRAGNTVEVAGTTATVDGKILFPEDAAAQARVILEKIVTALAQAGAEPAHVIRTRMYITDAADWEAVGRVHGEFFGEIRPVSTLVVVKGLVSPEMKVEIEATAWIPE